MEKPGYTAEEMRDRLGVTSVRTVYRRAQRGEIAVIRQGRRTYYRDADNPVATDVTDTHKDATVSDDVLSLVRAVIAQETRELTARVTRLEAEIASLRALQPPQRASTDSGSDDTDDDSGGDEVTAGVSPVRRWLRQWSWRRP